MDRIYLKDILNEVFPDGYKMHHRIYGGMMNRIYLIENHEGKKYIVFIPIGKANKMVNREYEKTSSNIIAELGLTLPYIYFDTKRGIKIREYIDGTPLNNYKEEIDYQKVADLLHLIHDSKTLAPNDYSPFLRLANYENRALRCAREPNKYRELKDFFSTNIQYLKTKSYVFCHNDFQKSNIVMDKDGNLKVIDFEFAGNNDPIYDIATFANNDIEEGEKLLDYYYNHKVSVERKKRFYLWRIFISLQWHVVAVTKHYSKEGETSSFDFLKVAQFFLNNAEIAKNKFLAL